MKIFSPAGQLLTASDTATSPEVATYTADSIPAGIYSMQVCPFDAPTVPFVAPGDYAGGVTTSDSGAPTTPTLGQPEVALLPRQPELDWSATTTPEQLRDRLLDRRRRLHRADRAVPQRRRRRPWDYHVKTGTPPSRRSATTPTPTRHGPAR